MGNKNQEMARKVAEQVAAHGGRAYYVGGMVRDRIMGKENKDIDIEVHGITPPVLEAILDDLGGHTELGKSFGIYGLKGYELDIAMPRKEKAIGKGHRDFQVFVDPYLGTEKAAQRRDFTINAMMEDILTGEVLDHFGGKRDLNEKILRMVDEKAFSEDPLRVLRGAQFAARFDLTMEEETLMQCGTIDLSTLPGERIFGELEKALLKAQKPSVFFETLRKMGQLQIWFPQFEALIGMEQNPIHHPEGDVWNHTMLVLDEAAKLRSGAKYAETTLSPRWELAFMLSALCHDLGKAVTTAKGEDGLIHAIDHEAAGIPLVKEFLKPMTGNKKLADYVTSMTELHMKPNVVAGVQSKKKTTNRMFDQAIDPEGLLLLARADHLGRPGKVIEEEKETFLAERLELYKETMAQPFVKGQDLLDAGITPGPEFRELLAYAHKLRLAGIVKKDALKQVLQHAEKITSRG